MGVDVGAFIGGGGAFGSLRRALNVEMNSMTWGESPSMLEKCSAASCLERVAAYSRTCCRPSSGIGSSWKSCSFDILSEMTGKLVWCCAVVKQLKMLLVS